MGFVSTEYFQGIVVAIYSWCFFATSSRLLPMLRKPPKKIFAFLSVLNGAICVGLVESGVRVSDMYITAVTVLVVECVLVFRGDMEMQVLAALHTGIHLVTVRSFSICVVALASPATMLQVITIPEFGFYTFIITYCIMFALLIVNAVVFNATKIIYSFKHKRQIRLVYGSALVICLYQYLCTKAFYYTIELKWFSVLQLLLSFLMLLGYYFIFICSASISKWANTSALNTQLEQNLRLQLSHYEAYARSERAIKIFKHDYKNLVLTVSSLLVNNKSEQALAVLEQMDHKLQQDLLVHRVYSTNIHVNAALHELANECVIHDIKFGAGVVLPISFDADKIAISALFAALSKIAIDGCKSCEANKAIEMFTNYSDDWLTLTLEFSSKDIKSAYLARASVSNTIEKLAAKSFVEKHSGFSEMAYENNVAKLFIHLNIAKEDSI